MSFRYARPTIALHWLSALVVGAAWAGGQLVDSFGRAAEPSIRSAHILLGLSFAALLLLRVVLRLSGRGGTPPAEPDMPDRVARIGHLLLYVLMAAVVVLGLANAWARGADIFGVFHFAAQPYADRALRHLIAEIHELAANALLIVAGLHAVAALVHHYILRDGVLRRMLPAG